MRQGIPFPVFKNTETKKQKIERALRTLDANEAEAECDKAWRDLRAGAQMGQPKNIILQKLQKALKLTMESNRLHKKPLGTRPWSKVVD